MSDVPMAGGVARPSDIPVPVLSDTPDLTGPIEEAKKQLRAAVRGDDAWFDTPRDQDEPGDDIDLQMHCERFLLNVGLTPTPDAIDQLTDVFLPCLRIMCNQKSHPWPNDGALWRKSGIGPVLIFARAKFMRYWYRTWIKGERHDDSGYDCINFIGFSLRADPDDQWGELGNPAPPGYPEDM